MGCGASSAPTAKPVDSGAARSLIYKGEGDSVQRSENSSCDADVIPDYWYNKKVVQKDPFFDMYYVHASEHSKFDDLMKASYVAQCTQDRPCPKNEHSRTPGGCPCVQPGGDPGLPVGFRTLRVIRVEASGMWDRYHKKLEAIKKKRGRKALARFEPPLLTESTTEKHKGHFAPLNSSLNEVYTFHGTFVRFALSIARNDFNINLAGTSRGTLYGKGAYLGESITKADEYAKDEPDGYYAGVFAVLVCRVCMGKLYNTSDDPDAASKIKNGEFDSTVGQRLFRELVIYDTDQIYPEYVVLYKRIYQHDVEEEFAKTLKQRFYMEVPLHWHNTAKSLREGFCEQYAVTPFALDFFQCLVDDSLEFPFYKLNSMHRIENAQLWKRYVEFKFCLRSKLGGPDGRKADEDSSLSKVEHQLKELTKWPCKFFNQKGGCRFAEKCRFSHNENALKLSNVSLSAGRRLPVHELDDQLNEQFLWYPCNKRESHALSKGHFRKEGAAMFFTGLDAALMSIEIEGNIKCAMLCRVICGLPDDDCTISAADLDSHHSKVEIAFPAQMYPEYMMELFFDDDAAKKQESLDTENPFNVDDPSASSSRACT